MKTERRTALKKILASAIGIAGLGFVAKANAPKGKITGTVVNSQEVPWYSELFADCTTYGNLVFVAGMGTDEPDTIENQTKICLDLIEKELIKAGSSMKKVLQTTVLIDDMANYDGMNAAYKGRFGAKPPARTTLVVAKGGLPVNPNTIVEIDCIAYI
jgi:enamine deaminase RidA (YjgF/YER057c/UK114 family)